MRILCFALPALSLLLLFALAAAQTERTQRPAGAYSGPGGLSLAVPTGWQATAAGDSGVVLRPVSGTAWPIEAVVWPVPEGGEASPAAAAAAQETALCRLAPYARSSQEAFTALDGRQGLLIMGQVQDRDGQLLDSVFVAYASLQRFAVVGTFGAAGSASEVVRGDFGLVARSLVFDEAGGPASTPLPVLPPAVAVNPTTSAPAPVHHGVLPVLPGSPTPDQPSAPAPSEVTGARTPAPSPAAPPPTPSREPVVVVTTPARPAAPDVSPAAPEASSVLQTHVSPTGYRLDVPPDWQVRLVAGRIEAVAPGTAGATVPRAAAFIWPWMRVGAGQDPVAVARQLLRSWDLVDGAADGLAARQTGYAAVLGGTVGRAADTRRLVACCSVASDCALLSGFICEPGDFTEQAPLLVEILASFSGGPWWAGSSVAAGRGRETWTDPDESGLQVPVPAGWKLRGKLQEANGLATLSLEGLSADQTLRVAWHQPALPLYRELTAVLADLGWREGDRYQEGGETTPLRVMPRLTPEEYLSRVWLAAGPRAMDRPSLDVVQRSQNVAMLVAGGEGLVAWAHDAATPGRQRLCLVATGPAPKQVSGGVWQASVMECEAPEGQLAQAAEALRSMVEGAQQQPGGTGHVRAGDIADLQQRARQALAALEGVTPQAEGAVAVLARLQRAGQGSPWVMPALALEPWQKARLQVQSLHPVGDALPELAAEFWK